MHSLTTLQTFGDALHITAATAELADHHWRQRARLLQLTGAQRLQLLVDLPGGAPLLLAWEPPELPVALAPGTRRRRGWQKKAVARTARQQDDTPL